MPRPRFAPGATVAFHLKPRPGPPRDAVGYAATRMAAPAAWLAAFPREGRLRVDGQAVPPGGLIDLARALRLEVDIPDPWPPHLAAIPMPLSILHEDSQLLVLDKPAGVLVHPARGHMDEPTLLAGVRHRYRESLGAPGATVGAAHRLDAGTSGVIVFARATTAYRAVANQFAAGTPHKEYLALTDGAPAEDHGEIRAPLGRDPGHPERMAVVAGHDGGKPAATEFHVLERGSDWAWLRICPKTGRLHQIRVHLAHRGWPVMGDAVYNPRPPRSGLERMALHAAALRIHHPIDGLPRRWEAPWPEALERARQAVRLE